MRTPEKQLQGLLDLAALVGKSECNTKIVPAGSDVAYLMAAHTPHPSQIVYADGGYDVWIWEPTGPEDTMTGGYHMQSPDLSIEDAAKVVVAEYHLAKAARIKQRRPDLNIDEIMKTLTRGYQK